jgi:hypothetical protein
MVGFPKYLNSKEDYYYIKDHFSTELWKPAWQALIDESKGWFVTGEVKSVEAGVTDDTHKVIEEKGTGETSETKYYQYELQTNPTCKMLRIGFTEDEITEALK